MNGDGVKDLGQEAKPPAESVHDAVGAALDASGLESQEPSAEDKAAYAAPEETLTPDQAKAAGLPDAPPKPEAAPAPDAKAAPDPKAAPDAKPADPKGEAKPEGDPKADPLASLMDEAKSRLGTAKPPARLREEDLAMPEEYKASGKEKQAERWGKLQGGYREQTARADALETQLEQVQPMVERFMAFDRTMQGIGATSEQVAAAVDYIGLVNNGNPHSLAQAREMLMAGVAEIDAITGQPSPTVDHVAQHPDLKNAVEKGELTEDYAKQIALARARDQHTQAREQQHRAGEQQRVANEQEAHAVAQASGDIEALDRWLAQNDPAYPAMRPVLEQTLMTLQQAGVPPAQWVPTLVQQRESLRSMAAAPPMAASPNALGGLAGSGNGRVAQLARASSSPTPGNTLPPVGTAQTVEEEISNALARAGLQ